MLDLDQKVKLIVSDFLGQVPLKDLQEDETIRILNVALQRINKIVAEFRNERLLALVL